MFYKKIVIFISAVLACVTLCFAAPETSADSAVVLDLDSGRVLYAKAEDIPLQIASTTKIMTALVVLEGCELSEVVRITSKSVGVEGSSLYLKAGERLTVKDLLYGLMLRSGNDAAVALAIHRAGTVEAFAELMNEKALALGLKNCHFENPNGLDAEGHLCSAYDLAVITAAAMELPEFREIVATKNYSFGNRSVANHNKLLSIYQGACGVKTGFTKSAGRTLVGAAERDGQTLITVTLRDPNDWDDHVALFNYGFEQYPEKLIIEKGQVMGVLPVVGGTESMVTVIASEEFCYPLKSNETPRIVLHLPDFAFAPVKRLQYMGKAVITLDGEKIGEALLHSGNEISETPPENKSLFGRLIG